ncbi:MAG TPA: tetratricopeptide repeat protein, partial [Tepidiformaceae bacterium]|nr:tetratricopeptide repeat protein [Tepidiformaceae bacterium]
MTNEANLESMTAEERARLKKQMSDQAVKLAVSSRWLEAANLNRDYLRTFGDEADAFNRLGKALSELGQITEARQSYSRSLELEPTNTIARRNLDRLAGMTDTAAAAAAPSQLDTRLFVEETGTAAVARLQATDEKGASLLDAGDLVELQVQGNAVNVQFRWAKVDNSPETWNLFYQTDPNATGSQVAWQNAGQGLMARSVSLSP